MRCAFDRCTYAGSGAFGDLSSLHSDLSSFQVVCMSSTETMTENQKKVDGDF